jgi:Asp-tRNA(Asn)/Glu-tRNA(Gln) amidotransferase A subunit family amidase
VTGLKPTWGRVSRHGAFQLAATLDHVGPMARNAADAAAMLAASGISTSSLQRFLPLRRFDRSAKAAARWSGSRRDRAGDFAT